MTGNQMARQLWHVGVTEPNGGVAASRDVGSTPLHAEDMPGTPFKGGEYLTRPQWREDNGVGGLAFEKEFAGRERKKIGTYFS